MKKSLWIQATALPVFQTACELGWGKKMDNGGLILMASTKAGKHWAAAIFNGAG